MVWLERGIGRNKANMIGSRLKSTYLTTFPNSMNSLPANIWPKNNWPLITPSIIKFSPKTNHNTSPTKSSKMIPFLDSQSSSTSAKRPSDKLMISAEIYILEWYPSPNSAHQITRRNQFVTAAWWRAHWTKHQTQNQPVIEFRKSKHNESQVCGLLLRWSFRPYQRNSQH